MMRLEMIKDAMEWMIDDNSMNEEPIENLDEIIEETKEAYIEAEMPLTDDELEYLKNWLEEEMYEFQAGEFEKHEAERIALEDDDRWYEAYKEKRDNDMYYELIAM